MRNPQFCVSGKRPIANADSPCPEYISVSKTGAEKSAKYVLSTSIRIDDVTMPSTFSSSHHDTSYCIFGPSWRLSVCCIWSKCLNISLMIIQHWFRLWFLTRRHRAITWYYVDQVLWCYMASLGHNKLYTLLTINSIRVWFSLVKQMIQSRFPQLWVQLINFSKTSRKFMILT